MRYGILDFGHKPVFERNTRAPVFTASSPQIVSYSGTLPRRNLHHEKRGSHANLSPLAPANIHATAATRRPLFEPYGRLCMLSLPLVPGTDFPRALAVPVPQPQSAPTWRVGASAISAVCPPAYRVESSLFRYCFASSRRNLLVVRAVNRSRWVCQTWVWIPSLLHN